MKQGIVRFAFLRRWLRRFWYPLLILALLSLQFVRLLLKSVSLEEWLAWSLIAIAGVLSIRFRLGGLLAVCGIFAVFAVSPINVEFGVELIFSQWDTYVPSIRFAGG